jgi:hypothetical protein
MVTESAAQASTEAVRPEKGNRRVERTVDLNDSEIAAVEAAELTPEAEPPNAPTAAGRPARGEGSWPSGA